MPPKRKAEVVVESQETKKKTVKASAVKAPATPATNEQVFTFEFSKSKKGRKEEKKTFVKWQYHSNYLEGNAMNQSEESWKDFTNKKAIRYLQDSIESNNPVTSPSPWFRMALPGQAELKSFRDEGLEKYVRCENPHEPGQYLFFILSPPQYFTTLREEGLKGW